MIGPEKACFFCTEMCAKKKSFSQIQLPEDEEISYANPEDMAGLLLPEELRSGLSNTFSYRNASDCFLLVANALFFLVDAWWFLTSAGTI